MYLDLFGTPTVCRCVCPASSHSCYALRFAGYQWCYWRVSNYWYYTQSEAGGRPVDGGAIAVADDDAPPVHYTRSLVRGLAGGPSASGVRVLLTAPGQDPIFATGAASGAGELVGDAGMPVSLGVAPGFVASLSAAARSGSQDGHSGCDTSLQLRTQRACWLQQVAAACDCYLLPWPHNDLAGPAPANLPVCSVSQAACVRAQHDRLAAAEVCQFPSKCEAARRPSNHVLVDGVHVGRLGVSGSSSGLGQVASLASLAAANISESLGMLALNGTFGVGANAVHPSELIRIVVRLPARWAPDESFKRAPAWLSDIPGAELFQAWDQASLLGGVAWALAGIGVLSLVEYAEALVLGVMFLLSDACLLLGWCCCAVSMSAAVAREEQLEHRARRRRDTELRLQAGIEQRAGMTRPWTRSDLHEQSFGVRRLGNALIEEDFDNPQFWALQSTSPTPSAAGAAPGAAGGRKRDWSIRSMGIMTAFGSPDNAGVFHSVSPRWRFSPHARREPRAAQSLAVTTAAEQTGHDGLELMSTSPAGAAARPGGSPHAR